MISSYQVKNPVVTALQETPGGTYEVGNLHRVRVYAIAEVPGVGIVRSSNYTELEVSVDDDDTKITWTASPGIPFGNEPAYIPPTGYIFLKWDNNTSGNCGFNYDHFIETDETGEVEDYECPIWGDGTNHVAMLQSTLVYAVTAQADVPRQSALSTNAAIEALAIVFVQGFADAIAAGSLTAGQVGVVNPEGSVTAPQGTLYFNSANSTFWVKASAGTGNTGWVQLI